MGCGSTKGSGGVSDGTRNTVSDGTRNTVSDGTQHTVSDGRGQREEDTTPATMHVASTSYGNTLGRHVYEMNCNPRGIAIIICNKNFQPSTNLPSRHYNGASFDVGTLQSLFGSDKLKFDVKTKMDNSKSEMQRIMNEESQRDHSQYDCFVCVIMSHGAAGDYIWGTDKKVALNDLVEPMKGDNCPSLKGKPKLFFIQACRGEKTDRGVDVADGEDENEDDEVDTFVRIPKEADILIIFSTATDHKAWINTEDGAWFIQAISKVFSGHASDREIMWLLTRVAYTVAYEYEGRADDGETMKQVPVIQSTLTKELYFN